MNDRYRLVFHNSFRMRMKAASQRAAWDPRGRDAAVVVAALDAREILRQGREGEFDGERLSFSSGHYDLRDCAEIKVAVFEEYTHAGKPMGPSHRMIYREYQGTKDDPRPIREILAFEHRACGLPFAVAAAALGRQKGRAVDALKDLPAPEPAIGRAKDPRREVTPPRLPLPPDIAAALAGAHHKPSRRPAGSAAMTKPPVRRPTRIVPVAHRDHH